MTAFRLLGRRGLVRVFQHDASGFAVVFVAQPGPLVHAGLVVPTATTDDRGLAHTLEHLVFCGSQLYPRQFLDRAALRCLSSGTNAYTHEDHTTYELTTAGLQGQIQALPILLDHVLRPLLLPEDFEQEVFSLTPEQAKGVVFSEMSAREWSREDRADLAIRRLVYSPACTYHYECGGLSKDIAKLVSMDCRQFHQTWYHPSRMVAVVVGDEKAWDDAENSPQGGLLHALAKCDALNQSITLPIPVLPITSFRDDIHQGLSERVPFPSEDTSVGSIVFAWPGPDYADTKSFLALKVLLRYLVESDSSPMRQAFVDVDHEHEDSDDVQSSTDVEDNESTGQDFQTAWAADVQADIRSYVTASANCDGSAVNSTTKYSDSHPATNVRPSIPTRISTEIVFSFKISL